MQQGQMEVRVLVQDRTVTEFHHNSQVFIEGRSGSDFKIQVLNKSPSRVLAVISVDGISIMDGKPASADSSGYLIPAWGNAVIPGWMIDSHQIAKFTFGSRKDSYAQQGGGNATNCGVIGVMFFAEKVKPVYQPTVFRGLGSTTQTLFNGAVGSSYSAVGSNTYGSAYASSATTKSAGVEPKITLNASVNNLGTEFGTAEKFESREVSFEKGISIGTMALYYDDARGLKARGIVVERPSRQQYQTTPNPFPATGCKPPRGWQG